MAGLRRFAAALLLLWPAVASVDGPTITPVHPLDPLTADEITAAADLLRADGRVGETASVNTIVLDEPAKEDVLKLRPGDPVRRRAFAIVYDRKARGTFEAVLDLTARKEVSWRRLPGVQPGYAMEDFTAVVEAVRGDPRWREALRRRGITDLDNVQIDAGPGGHYGLPVEEGRRLSRAIAYYRGRSMNPYARPIEGLVALVDLDRKTVLELTDTGTVPLPPYAGDLGVKAGPAREMRPLQVVQPKGADFVVRGHEVRWQSWRFRYGFNPREGLIVYTVGWEDQGRLRPILYRGSLSEMVVPYADPSPAWFFRNVFDVGEYGLGSGAVSLDSPADAPANATFLPVTFATAEGRPVELERAVALFERDGGLLWKHLDYPTGRAEARRARDLVLSYTAAAGNYTYGFEWVFHQDGSLEVQVLLTGVMQVKAVAPGAGPAAHDSGHGHRVTPNLEGIHHQHFFSFRLDLDVDGPADNAVVELNTEAVPVGPANPYRTAFALHETPLRTEGQAQRRLNLLSGRAWKVVNRSVRNALGQPVGYLLEPGENALSFAAPDSWLRKRAGFLGSHLWVTPYDPAQMYSAGAYVNQSRGEDGLPAWVKANRSIDGRDVVLWYTMGITHLPRPEDWPVISAHRAGFRLVPSGFFAHNPGLELARPQ